MHLFDYEFDLSLNVHFWKYPKEEFPFSEKPLDHKYKAMQVVVKSCFVPKLPFLVLFPYPPKPLPTLSLNRFSHLSLLERGQVTNYSQCFRIDVQATKIARPLTDTRWFYVD